MSPKLENKLYIDFPKLFAQKDLPKEQTCMCWGIETPDEWYEEIYSACEVIQEYIDYYRKKQIEFTQVKEKFGNLCMYYDGKDSYIDGVIAVIKRILNKNDSLRLE